MVEQLSSGITRILRNYDKSIYNIYSNFVRVTFPFIEYENMVEGLNEGLNGGLNQPLEEILSLIKRNPGIKAKEIPDKLKGRALKTVEKQIATLKSRGIVERRGSRKTGGYYIRNI